MRTVSSGSLLQRSHTDGSWVPCGAGGRPAEGPFRFHIAVQKGQTQSKPMVVATETHHRGGADVEGGGQDPAQSAQHLNRQQQVRKTGLLPQRGRGGRISSEESRKERGACRRETAKKWQMRRQPRADGMRVHLKSRQKSSVRQTCLPVGGRHDSASMRSDPQRWTGVTQRHVECRENLEALLLVPVA